MKKSVYISIFLALIILQNIYSQSDSIILAPASQLGGVVNASAIKDSYAYIGRITSLQVMDLNQAEFQKVAELELGQVIQDIYISDDYAFIISGGLVIVDISDPLLPVLSGNVEKNTGNEVHIYVDGNFAYISDNTEGLMIFDVTDKSAPFWVNTFDNNYNLLDVSIEDDYAFVIDNVDISNSRDNKLRVIDVSDKTDPVEIASLVIDGANSIFTVNDLAFITSTTPTIEDIGMQIVDISAPENPVKKGFLPTKIVNGSSTRYNSASKVVVDNNRAYIICSNYLYLVIADVSDVSNPVEIGHYEINNSWGFVHSLDIIFPNIYVTVEPNTKVGGLMEINASDLSDIYVNKKTISPQNIVWVEADTNYMYLASKGALWIYDMKDPGNPDLINYYEKWGGMNRIYKFENKLILLNHNSLKIIDISDPLNAKELGTKEYDNPSIPSEVYASGNFIYLLLDCCHFQIIDISDPSNPVKTGELPIGGIQKDIVVDSVKEQAFILYSFIKDGFQIFDVSDKSNPVLLTDTIIANNPVALDFKGDTLFIGSNNFADGKWMIAEWDISNPKSPVKINELTGEGIIWGLEIEHNFILASINTNFISGNIREKPSIAIRNPASLSGTIAVYIDKDGNMVIKMRCPSKTPTGTSSATTSGGEGYVTTTEGTEGHICSTKLPDGDHGIVIQTIKIPPRKKCCLKTVVRPEIAGNDYEPYNCKASPSCTTGVCSGGATVAATPGQEWVFKNWSGAAAGNSINSEAPIVGKLGCPLCADNIAYANFVPWMLLGGGGNSTQCPFMAETEVTAMILTMTPSKSSDWEVDQIAFDISGDPEMSKYIKKAKLVWDGNPDGLEIPHIGGGSVVFNIGSYTLTKGKTEFFALLLTFDEMVDLKCPFKPKELIITVSDEMVSARSITFGGGRIDPLPTEVVSTISTHCIINTDTDETYEKIQDAVDEANDGNTILVCPGTYEENVVVDKPLSINSIGGEVLTIVKGVDKDKPVFEFSSKHIELAGFTILGAQGSKESGVYLSSGDCKIMNVQVEENGESGIKCENCYGGLELTNVRSENNHDSNGVEFTGINGKLIINGYNNKFSHNGGTGIYVLSGKVHFSGSGTKIEDNSDRGIYCYGELIIDENAIDLVADNGYIYEHGGGIEAGKLTELSGITIEENYGFGLKILDKTELLVKDVIIKNNNGPRGDGILYNRDDGKITIENCSILKNENNGIFTESKLIIKGTNNLIDGNKVWGLEVLNDIVKEPNARIVVKNNGAEKNKDYCGGINAHNCSYFGKGILIENNYGPGLEIFSTEGVNVLEDIISRNNKGPNGYGILYSTFIEKDTLIIKGAHNEFTGNDGDGIRSKYLAPVKLMGINTKLQNNLGFGISSVGSIQIIKGAVKSISGNALGGISSAKGVQLGPDLIIENNNGTGIVCYNCNTMVLENIILRNNKGIYSDGVNFTGKGENAILTIKGNKNEFIGNGNHGIHTTNADVLIEGSGTQISSNGGWGIKADGNIEIKEGAVNSIQFNGGAIKNGGGIQAKKEIKPLKNIEISNNAGTGIEITLDDISNKLILENVKINGNFTRESDGINLLLGDVIIIGAEHSEINNNGRFGIRTLGKITIKAMVQIKDNGVKGISAEDNVVISPSAKNSVISGNGWRNHLEGGGIYCRCIDLTPDFTIEGNYGTGLWINCNNETVLKNIKIKNQKGKLGNGISVFKGDLRIVGEKNEISNNSNYAIISNKGRLWIDSKDCLIHNNKGGGIVLWNGDLIFKNTNIIHNGTTGIWVKKGNRLYGENFQILRNTGNGIETGVNRLELYNGVICNNDGWGLYTYYDKPTLVNTTICENNLGGIYWNDTKLIEQNLLKKQPLSKTIQNELKTIDNDHCNISKSQIVNNEGEGIKFNEDKEFLLYKNNIFGNKDNGIKNLSETITIKAANNWWGDSSGPGGSGPGKGEEVSDNIEFTPWLLKPVGLVITIPRDTVFIPLNKIDSVSFYINNWLKQDDSVEVSLLEDYDWIQGVSEFSLILQDNLGADAVINIRAPEETNVGTINKIKVHAVSLTDETWNDIDSVYVLIYESQLAHIKLSSDTFIMNPGNTIQFFAQGLDQYGKEYHTEFEWQISGGGNIDNTGLFTSAIPGEYLLVVSDSEHLFSDTAVIIIREPSVFSGIEVITKYDTLEIGEQKQLLARGFDQYGDNFFFTPYWFSDADSITLNGLFKATELGDFIAIVMNEDSTFIDTAYIHVKQMVAVKDTPLKTEKFIILYQNYPNPFTGTTTIPFYIRKGGEINLRIYDFMGRAIGIPYKAWYPAGTHKVELKTATLPQGIYFYELREDNHKEIKKMIKL